MAYIPGYNHEGSSGMGRSIFLSRAERRNKIEIMLQIKDWSWYKLGREMRTNRSNVVRAFKDIDGNDPSLTMLKRAARALGVSVGFLVDREVKR